MMLLKLRLTIVCMIVMLPIDFFCMAPIRSVLQSRPMRGVIIQSARSLSSRIFCDCPARKCYFNRNVGKICKMDDLIDDIDQTLNDNVAFIHNDNNFTSHSAYSAHSYSSRSSYSSDSSSPSDCASSDSD